MFEISKRMEIAGAHCLDLPYDSKCKNIHGHGWVVIMHFRANQQQVNDNNGMVIDFAHVKNLIHGHLDHKYLNDLFDFNPTAENMAKWMADQIEECFKVTVQESEGNIATYYKEDC